MPSHIQSVQGVIDLAHDRLGDMGVDFGGFGTGVPEKLLDVAQVDAMFQQVCGKAVAKRVQGGRLGDAGACLCALEDFAGTGGRVGSTFGARKEEFFGAVPRYVFPQFIQSLLGQQAVSVLLSLGPFDADEHAVAVDVVNAQPDGFAGA